jgi:hypothetical protein
MALRTERDHYAARVQVAKVMLVTINRRDTAPLARPFASEHDGHVMPGV